MTNQDIFERLREILIETFDIEAERIRPEARLHEDLDIDSIDAVDLIVKLKPLVGKKLQPEAFKAVRTLQDVINALQGLIKDSSAETEALQAQV
jgi:acyl carrier protein